MKSHNVHDKATMIMLITLYNIGVIKFDFRSHGTGGQYINFWEVKFHED